MTRWRHAGTVTLGIAAVAVLVALPHPVFALALPELGNLIPSTFQNLNTAFTRVWDTVVGVAGVTFLGYLLYGGFLYLTSAGDDSIAQRARHTLRDAAIGIVLVLLAWPLGIFVLSVFDAQGLLGASKSQVPTGSAGAGANFSASNTQPTTSTGTNPPQSSQQSAATTAQQNYTVKSQAAAQAYTDWQAAQAALQQNPTQNNQVAADQAKAKYQAAVQDAAGALQSVASANGVTSTTSGTTPPGQESTTLVAAQNAYAAASLRASQAYSTWQTAQAALQQSATQINQTTATDAQATYLQAVRDTLAALQTLQGFIK